MNWGVANSLQFVKSSPTVVWAVVGVEEGAAADASPPIAEWLLGTGPCWAGLGRQNMPLHFTRHRYIKIWAETYMLCRCFGKFRKPNNNNALFVSLPEEEGCKRALHTEKKKERAYLVKFLQRSNLFTSMIISSCIFCIKLVNVKVTDLHIPH